MKLRASGAPALWGKPHSRWLLSPAFWRIPGIRKPASWQISQRPRRLRELRKLGEAAHLRFLQVFGLGFRQPEPQTWATFGWRTSCWWVFKGQTTRTPTILGHKKRPPFLGSRTMAKTYGPVIRGWPVWCWGACRTDRRPMERRMGCGYLSGPYGCGSKLGQPQNGMPGQMEPRAKTSGFLLFNFDPYPYSTSFTAEKGMTFGAHTPLSGFKLGAAHQHPMSGGGTMSIERCSCSIPSRLHRDCSSHVGVV